MDWMNRGNQPTNQPAHTGGTSRNKRFGSMNLRVISVTLLFCVTILIVALVGLIALGGPKPERTFVEGNKLQAVFLNGGQVYFGNIRNLNDQYLRMSNIYYLRVNQTVQPDQDNNNNNNQNNASNDISLVKLGCELHGPVDEMLINREHVIFWENLKDDGQVAKAVSEYVKQNPNGQNCAANQQQNTNTNSNSGSNNNATQPQNSNTNNNGGNNANQ